MVDAPKVDYWKVMYWHGAPLADSDLPRNQTILACRMALLDRVANIVSPRRPTVGDYIDFADGVTRRVSHVWDWEADGPQGSYQTSNGGSFYLGEGYISFSGSLYTSVPGSTLTLTEEKRAGRVWFFRNDWPEANNGVETQAEFRVYKCSEVAPK